MKRFGLLLAALLPIVLLNGAFAGTLPSNDPERDAMRAYFLQQYPDYDLAGTHTITYGEPGSLQTANLAGTQAMDFYITQLRAQGSEFCAQPPPDLQSTPPGTAPDRLYGTTCYFESGFKKINDSPGAPGATCPSVQPLGQNSFGNYLPTEARNIINAGTQDVTQFGIARADVSSYDTYTYMKFGREVVQKTSSRLNHFPPGASWPLSLTPLSTHPTEYTYGAQAGGTQGYVWEFLYVDWAWLDSTTSSQTFNSVFGNTLWIYCDVEDAASGKVYNNSVIQPIVWKAGTW